MSTIIPFSAPAETGASPASPQSTPRRSFLKTSAILTGVLALGSPLALLAPSRAWALELGNLNQPQADTLLLLVKTLYPHRDLPEAIYALAIKDIDAKAGEAESTQLINSGIKNLLAASKSKWLTLNATERTQLITAIQKDPFIEMVRARCITSLYSNDMAFAHFGYEGESFSKGGYLYRGFNDLTWLPNPSPEASPAAGR